MRQTNVQVMRKLVKKAESNTILQLFLMTALEKYSDMVLADKRKEWENSFISKFAFEQCAGFVKQELDKHFKQA